jgi:hypothetical protein
MTVFTVQYSRRVDKLDALHILFNFVLSFFHISPLSPLAFVVVFFLTVFSYEFVCFLHIRLNQLAFRSFVPYLDLSTPCVHLHIFSEK